MFFMCHFQRDVSFHSPPPKKSIMYLIPGEISAIRFRCCTRKRVQGNYNKSCAAAEGLLISMEAEDLTLMNRITQTGEANQTLDFKPLQCSGGVSWQCHVSGRVIIKSEALTLLTQSDGSLVLLARNCKDGCHVHACD